MRVLRQAIVTDRALRYGISLDPNSEVLVDRRRHGGDQRRDPRAGRARRGGGADRAVLRLVRRPPSRWPGRSGGRFRSPGTAGGSCSPRRSAGRDHPEHQDCSWSTPLTTPPARCSPRPSCSRLPSWRASTICWCSATRCTSTWCRWPHPHAARCAARHVRAHGHGVERPRRSTSPAGRTGWACGPAELIDAVRAAKKSCRSWPAARSSPPWRTRSKRAGMGAADAKTSCRASEICSRPALRDAGFDVCSGGGTYFLLADISAVRHPGRNRVLPPIPREVGVAAVP